MVCTLCGREVTLLDLDHDGWDGQPAHDYCAQSARDALAMIRAEPDPRRHRGHPRKLAAA